MSEPTPGAGDVDVELDGKVWTLKPSWQACMSISRLGGQGGIDAVVRGLESLQMDVFVDVLRIGLGLNPNQAKMLPEAVYRVGLISLRAPLIRFCTIVANGGRPVGEDEKEDEPDPLVPA